MLNNIGVCCIHVEYADEQQKNDYNSRYFFHRCKERTMNVMISTPKRTPKTSARIGKRSLKKPLAFVVICATASPGNSIPVIIFASFYLLRARLKPHEEYETLKG